jgi:hypothetical protein
VHFDIMAYIDCPANVRVTNLASWAGVPNPTTTADLTWISAAIGAQGPVERNGPDVGITAEPVTCSKSLENEHVYDYRFFDPLHPDAATVVPVGEIGTLHVPRDTGAQVWTLGNARAGCVGGVLGTCPSEGYPYDHWYTQALE